MRKKTNKSRLMLALWLGIAWPALAGGPFVINGKLAGVEDSAVVRLFRPDGSMGAAVAADTLRNGRFMLCGEVEQLEMLSIAVQGEGFPSMGLNVWVEPDAVVSVSGRDKLLVTWKVKNRMPQQSDENRYIDASRSEYIQLQQALINYASLNILQRNKRDELLKQIDSLQMLIRGTEICMMQTTPYSEVWLTRFQKLAFWSKEAEGHPYRKELLALYELWPQPRKESPLGKFFQRKFFLPGMVWTGDEMADADLLDTLGRVHRLADYKGKYLLLDFWSIGCDPCRRAQPEMRRMGEVYRDVLTVISITQDGETSWKKYSAEQGIGGVNLRDPKRGAGLSGRYSVERIPHYVLISPEGKVITSWAGYAAGQLEKKLDELLPDSVGRPYLIEGKVQGVEDGTVVVMGRTTLRQATVVARDTIRNGTFRFSGLLNGPTHMVLRGDPRQGFSYTRLDFWAGPGTTVITGDDKMIRSWRVESTLPEQIEENRYAEACREAVHRQQVCRIERSRAGREKTPQTDSLWAEYMALQRLIDSAEIEMLQTLPNGVTPSPAWIDRFEMVAARANDKEYRHRDIVLALYDRLSDSVKRSAKGIGIAHSLFPAELLPGDVAPDGELVDPFGKMYRLADLRSPGKYMLLDFWASGCPPCRMSAPEMKEVAETYRDRLTVVAVNLDEVRAEWLKAAEKDGIVWTNLADPQGFDGLPYRYGVKGIPHYALLSPDGKLVASWAGYGPGYLKKNVAEAFAKADAASG
jgi:thiol-disulfide isomerase/thioredoxin